MPKPSYPVVSPPIQPQDRFPDSPFPEGHKIVLPSESDEFDPLVALFVKDYGMSSGDATAMAMEIINRQDGTTGKEFIRQAHDDPQLPPAPITTPDGAPLPPTPAMPTQKHHQDATMSAWQQYSQMLDGMNAIKPVVKDASMGAPAPKRKGRY